MTLVQKDQVLDRLHTQTLQCTDVSIGKLSHQVTEPLTTVDWSQEQTGTKHLTNSVTYLLSDAAQQLILPELLPEDLYQITLKSAHPVHNPARFSYPYAILQHENYVYVGGDNVNDSTSQGKRIYSLYRFDVVSGQVDESWLPVLYSNDQAYTYIQTMTYCNGYIVAGGYSEMIDQDSGDYQVIWKISIDTAEVTSIVFCSDTDFYIDTICALGNFVYVGGWFDHLRDAENNSIAYLFRLDTSTWLIDTTWNPQASDELRCILAHGDYLYYIAYSEINMGANASQQFGRLLLSDGTQDTTFICSEMEGQTLSGMQVYEGMLYVYGTMSFTLEDQTFNGVVRFDLSADSPVVDTEWCLPFSEDYPFINWITFDSILSTIHIAGSGMSIGGFEPVTNCTYAVFKLDVPETDTNFTIVPWGTAQIMIGTTRGVYLMFTYNWINSGLVRLLTHIKVVSQNDQLIQLSRTGISDVLDLDCFAYTFTGRNQQWIVSRTLLHPMSFTNM